MLRRIRDFIKGKAPLKLKRSSQWPKIRKEHLFKEPFCLICEGKKSLNVHHIQPFHLHPELELEPTNLTTLCESKKHGINCHLLVGHLGNFKNINPNVIEDANFWNKRLKEDNQ